MSASSDPHGIRKHVETKVFVLFWLIRMMLYKNVLMKNYYCGHHSYDIVSRENTVTVINNIKHL